MNISEINILLQQQMQFFNSGITKEISFRIENLQKLKQIIINNEQQILDVLYLDLHKSETEAYTSEIAFVIKEIDFTISNLKKWTKIIKVSTSMVNQPGSSHIRYEPYGTVLIIGPWNYPFNLVISPLIGAMAAGNCAIIKPSENSVHTSNLIIKLINENFPNDYLFAIVGDASVTQNLINEHIDYIFFTGSTNVGKMIMKSAAEYLIPVTLELGGKSPCIVDSNIDLEVTVKRIVWGKFFNAGQTCIAPDFLLVNNKIKDDFLKKLSEIIIEFYPEINSDCKDYARIINLNHFNRLSNLMIEGQIIIGGDTDINKLYISPTVIAGLDYNSKAMSEEIFGPILPILFYDNLDEVIQQFYKMPKPLSIYFFSNDKSNQNRILTETSSGSVCINGTIHHIISNRLPFGGVGNSGMGNYHGKASFATFSHKKSVLKKSFIFDIKSVYPPYKTKLSILKIISSLM